MRLKVFSSARPLLGAVAALLLSSASTARALPEGFYPTLGINGITSGTLVENHADALLHWAEAGIKDAVLLHVDAQDDLLPSGADHVKELAALAAGGDLTEARMSRLRVKDNLFNDANFNRAAFHLGFIKRVYWVTPYPYFAADRQDPRLERLLEQAGVSSSDLKGFVYREGCLEGLHAGVPLTVCGEETLPRIQEPVLLSIDADYFTTAAFARKRSYLESLTSFFRSAADRHYRLRDTVVSYSVEGGFVTAQSRWVGDVAVQLMRFPETVFQTSPSADISILQKVTTAMFLEKFGDMEAIAGDYLDHFPVKPPSILFALAYAEQMQGKFDKALQNATDACRADRGYCYGLLELGILATEAGELEAGKPFLAAARKYNPDMTYGEAPLAFAYLKADVPDLALPLLEKLKAEHPVSTYDFAIGVAFLAKKDQAKALEYFDKGLEIVREAGESVSALAFATPDNLHAVRIAAMFYRDKGMEEKADLLAKSPLLR